MQTLLFIFLWGVLAAGDPVQIRSIDGQQLKPFQPLKNANVLFFISTDCPISNSYAPEIQRLCERYAAQGVGCSLYYEDIGVSAKEVRKHLDEYRYRGIPAAIDDARKIAKPAKAEVTPQAVLVDAKGEIRYRGRIDNRYADLGKPRQHVTEHDLSDAIDAVLAGRPVAHPETQAVGCYITDPALLRK